MNSDCLEEGCQYTHAAAGVSNVPTAAGGYCGYKDFVFLLETCIAFVFPPFDFRLKLRLLTDTKILHSTGPSRMATKLC